MSDKNNDNKLPGHNNNDGLLHGVVIVAIGAAISEIALRVKKHLSAKNGDTKKKKNWGDREKNKKSESANKDNVR